jgi:Asp-tRNAAsn/Glu-tRNAGln amidotransferase A subunit and related amidases
MSFSSARPWSAANAASRLEDVLSRAASDAPEAAHVYTGLFPELARADVAALDGRPDTALKGALVSIKDLLDVAGFPSRAASPALLDTAPAEVDSDVAARLRAAGAILVGHTNMTELAYSGIGINPHFGTPANPLYPRHAPGGSSSGAAISVATGLADVAIGSDTGGSLRIPAAFTGLVGFKPSQASVSRRGCVPLSVELDSLGPIARTVADCETTWRILSGVTREAMAEIGPRLVVPENFGCDELDPAVEAGFDAAVTKLREAGYSVVSERLPSLHLYGKIPAWQFASVEARSRFDTLLSAHADIMDRRVVARMRRSEDLSALDYRRTLDQRAAFVARLREDLGNRYLLMPTVAILPPALKDLERDEDFNRLNVLALRNTTMVNVGDGCSISVPFREGGDTIGVMISAPSGRDPELLALAARIEALFASN